MSIKTKRMVFEVAGNDSEGLIQIAKVKVNFIEYGAKEKARKLARTKGLSNVRVLREVTSPRQARSCSH